MARVGNRQIRYIEEGRGQPVILLHGASLGSSADGFTRNLAALAGAGIRAIAVDRPGYGLSDGPTEMSAGGHQKFVLDFMDALNIERTILVGHSQQASVVAGLAFEQPNRVPRAVIVGPGLLPPPSGGTAREEGEQIDAEPSLEWTREQLKGNLFNHDLITPEATEVRNRMSKGKAFAAYREGGRPQGPAGDAEPMWKRVGSNPDRFLVLAGRQDRATTAEQCDIAHKMFPNLKLVDYEGCRHLVHWDHADDFARQVISFVNAGAGVA
ncbi:MAG: 4,5-9,10-diseco-3-hydroxy-5,9, 17-trioxoandrosta-1(10),2-diene-4-oatehydrolase [Chloroflexi bacterium]|nr:4,5-9,10-diseco-3-hydroxy-5,9, 17-trioxoandrosta-1(10),2-diene-4-oatehydrolase [Chloroflexota bacterium]